MRGILLLLAVSWCGSAQSADPTLTFEVASVKVTGAADSGAVTSKKSIAGAVPASADPIRFSRRRATLASLLISAYSLKPQQLIGPDWLTSTSERYEIEAKVPDGATAQQQMIMLRNLLADRFRVKVHRETKEMPVYELTVAKGGLKLKQSAPGPNALRPLQADGTFRLSNRNGATAIVLDEQGTMETLAAKLSRVADRSILDRTGLAGNYDIVMFWTAAANSSPDAADPGIDLFAALESQAGLKLVPKKAPVEVLVVDHAEKSPTEN